MQTNPVKPTLNVTKRQLGKRAPRLDGRTLKLAKYLTPSLPTPPLKAGYIDKVQTWPMYLNDELGDCVIAAAGHMIEQWTAFSSATSSPVLVTNKDILKGYEAVGGYVPGNPDTDNGCDMLTALKYWRRTGFGGHKVSAFVSVDYTNQKEVEQAIYLFGNVYIGLALPLTAQNPVTTEPSGLSCWQMTAEGTNGDASPGSWGGHCVPIVGYSSDPAGHPGVALVTWGEQYAMTWKFANTYVDEMWAVLSPDWFESNGDAPNGFNLDQLKADLAQL